MAARVGSQRQTFQGWLMRMPMTKTTKGPSIWAV